MQQSQKILTLFLAIGMSLSANAAVHSKKASPKKPVKTAPTRVVHPPKGAVGLLLPIRTRAIPFEYSSYFLAKSVLAKKKADLGAIEHAETALLTSKMHDESKILDRKHDELFYALEIRRGEAYAQKKQSALALESFRRGLNGLGSYQWIYYWPESASKALASICTRNKKKKDEDCLALVKRVVEGFPRAALETKALKDLPTPEATSSAELSSDRLSQSYTERVNKDEQDFDEVLNHFLNDEKSDLLKTAQEFISNYPKSILRFRAQFLMAETYLKKNDPQEAAPLYQSLIDEVPISYYAVIASERLSKPLRNQVKKDPLTADPKAFNLGANEQSTLERAYALYRKKHFDEVGIELDSLSRTRSYTSDFLVYLMQFASKANQSLDAFRIANELVQRRYDGFLRADMINLIFPDRYRKEIEAQSKQNGLDPLLVTSLIKQESGFRAPIISASGALGLMQLMPFTAIDTQKDLHLAALGDPMTNISVGTQYLASLMQKYSNNIVYALSAYNAGPYRVAKWRKEAKPDWGMVEFIESIPFRETRDYVMSILRNRYWYQYRRGLPLKSVFEAWIPDANPSPSPSVQPTPASSK